MFFLVKLLEFSTKKIARQEAQAETKCLKASYFLWRALALALVALQRLFTGVTESLPADDSAEAVDLLLEGLGFLFSHTPQLDCVL